MTATLSTQFTIHPKTVRVNSTSDPRDRQHTVEICDEPHVRGADVVGIELADPLPEGLSRVKVLIGGEQVLEWRLGSPKKPLRLTAGKNLLTGAVIPARLRPSLAKYHCFHLLFEFDARWIEARDGGAMVPEFRDVPVYSDELEEFFDGNRICIGRRVAYRSETTGYTRCASGGVSVQTPEVRLSLEPVHRDPPDKMGDIIVERIRLRDNEDPEYAARSREKRGMFEADDEVFVQNRLRYICNIATRYFNFS